MNVPRRVINLAGALLVVVVFATGVMLLAMPAYLQSGEIDNQRRAIETSNAQLSAEIATLQKQQAELPEIEKQLGKLRDQIPSIPQLDDISRLAVASANSAQASVTRIEFSDPVPFAPNSQQVAGPLGSSVSPASPSSSQDQAAGDGAAVIEEVPSSQTNSSTDASQSDKLQYPVTIEATADSTNKLVHFLDELRKGPRLLRVTTVALTGPTAESPAKVALAGYAYLQLAPEGALR